VSRIPQRLFFNYFHAIAQGALDLQESLAWLWREYDPGKTGQEYVIEESERARPVFRMKIANPTRGEGGRQTAC